MSDIKEGQIVEFAGYSEDVQDPILQPGDRLKVRAVNADGGLIVDKLDADGNIVPSDVAETLFPEEITLLPEQDGEADQAIIDEAADADAAGEEIQGDDAPVTAEADAQADAAAEAAAKPKGKGGKTKAAKAKDQAKAPKAKTTPAKSAAEVTTSPDATPVAGPQSELVRAAIASVAGSDAEESAASLVAAKSLVNRVDETYYTLGGVLSYIKETGVYKSLGYDGKRGFADYVKAELGIDYRKAQYLIAVFDTVQEAGLNEQRLSEIGWSKAIQIMRVGDVSMDKLGEDFDNLIEFAKANSRDDLITHIKTTYEGIQSRTPSGEGTKVNTLTFKASAEEAEQMERALTNAKRLAGTDDANAALRYILNDWLMMTEGTDIDLDTSIATVEAKFGVTLQVVEPGDQQEGEEASETAAEGETATA